MLSRRSSEHHQQLTNGSTILFTFTFPVNLDFIQLIYKYLQYLLDQF
jgi:hypothetical protein